MLADARSLYDEDLLLWTQEQARILRAAALAGVNAPVDWENVAEEIESLGKSQRQELRNRLTTIIEHLFKLEYSNRVEPREGWEETVGRSRVAIEILLEDNPSLRRELDALIERSYLRCAPMIAEALAKRGEIPQPLSPKILEVGYSVDQVLGGWLPPEPGQR